jgi:hypothetical protein
VSEGETDPLVTDFVAKLIQRVFQGEAEGSSDLRVYLQSSVEQALVATGAVYGHRFLVPIGSGVRSFCSMPNNGHSFSGAGKHCPKCNVDYCDQHSISHCVRCGHKI